MCNVRGVLIEVESRMVVIREWGERGAGKQRLMEVY
jgi:hypothetical protein